MRSLLVASLLLASTAAHASVAQKVRCANAYEQAQRTRNEGQLLASRAHLLVCTEESCPAVLRTECIKWLEEVDQAMPTVLIVADVGGAETADVTVSVDGTKVLDRLDGKAIPIDPGAHIFRFVRPGSVPVEQKVLVREGEKRRPIAVSFPATPAPKAEQPTRSSTAPTATWVLGGIGIAALGVSVPLYVSAYGQKSTLDAEPCASAGTCDPDRVSTVKRRFIVADVVAGVGLAALGGAMIVWIATPSPSVSAAIAPVPGGVASSLAITF